MNLTKPQKLIYDMERFAGGAIAVLCGSMLIDGEREVSEIKKAVNELYRLNSALRIRISERNGEVSQGTNEYAEQDVRVLCFEEKAQLDRYAEEYAKIPLDLYGCLCEFQVITLRKQYGVLIKLHHLIGDAWTLALLGTQFNKLINGETVEAYSYADYVERENSYIQSKRYEKDRAFFTEQFKKCDEVTYLSEKQGKSLNACRKTFVIGAEQTNRINAYAIQNGTSAFMLFTAALSTYINRTKMNAEKFYIGTAVLNRSGAKDNNTVGMFVNTAPMLIELDNSKSFADNLSSIEETALSVFRHQKFNYGDVLSTLRKEFSFAEKLYDVLISYQNATVTGADIETTWYHPGSQNEALQIHIDDRDHEGIFRIHYDYQTDHFTEHEIESLHHHLSILLQDAIATDTKKLYELELLSPEEKDKVLFAFNNTSLDYQKDKCVQQLFEEQVVKTPDKVAVIACDQTLTYRELNEQANRIAHALIERGVKVGDLVAFALPRTSNLISVMFGILKAGAAYLPIDLDYPKERVEYILEDSRVKLFITEENIESFLNNSTVTNHMVSMSSEDLCYCLFTSGSTGKPKGTLLKHRGIVNLVTDLGIYGDLSNCKRIGFMTTITFDVATQEILTALLNGYTGVLMPERKETSPEIIIDGICEHHIDVMYATPTYFASLTDTQEMANRLLGAVKVVCLAGEKFFLNENVLSVKDKYNVIFENQYGPVELHVIATATTMYDPDDGSIGKPIRNNKAYIVDSNMHCVPIGVAGELCMTGDGVGVGYLNRPQLTAEKFIDNPFGEGKLYKTGDLAYWREDGNIVYVGRNDFQVKIRGLRIELGEIENAIEGIDGISYAVVVARKNSEGRQLICAFYTGMEMDTKEIRIHIGKKLPKYMLPHIFTHLDEMPLTSSGKVNRKALPEVDLYAIDNAVEHVAPTTEQEKVLADAIGATLGTDKVGILDNFFDIGGDSLKAIELISKLEKQGYHTDTKTIFECDTIKELAQRLTLAEKQEEVFDYSGDIPATDAQMRVYTAQSMRSDSTTYNVPYAFKVESLDVNCLQNAVNKLIARHESLRTHFGSKDGRIIQIINDVATCTIEELNTDDIAAFIRPFNLGQAPLLRVGYYENTVMIDMHHIITDGGSMPVFLGELNELYMGRPLENTPVQYKQFALQKQDHSESEKYWLSVYGDEVPVLEINTDFHRDQKQSFNGSVLYETVDIDLHHQIITFCKEQNITPYVFYMGAFSILLSKFSGSEDVVVGMPISGRSSKYLDTIGMFVNTIALRSQPSSKKTVAKFLQEIKAISVDAMEHQDYPYGELVKKLHLDTLGRNPLFDVMFAYQSEQMTDVIFGDKKAELLSIPITTSKYDFTYNVMPRDNDVVIMVEYCTDLFKENTIRRFADGYKQILTQMLVSGKTLTDISAVTECDLRKILYQFNDTAKEFPGHPCVHQLFEEQVVKTPDKVAVIACDQTLTYRELNEQANRIAHALIERGVNVGDIIAFSLPRKSYLLAIMLGILKSGATYLPIDPDYPLDRIEYMLSDSHAKLFITDNSIGELLSNRNTYNPKIIQSGNDICYCIYTSGSTGKPKGVLLKHSNVVNYTSKNSMNVVHAIIQDSYESIVSVTTCGFDIFVTESLLPLVNGLRIVLANEEQSKIQSHLQTLLKKYPVDVLQTTPSKLKTLIADKTKNDYLQGLKAIVLGGEAMDVQLLTLLKHMTSAKIFNIYGPTETTVWSSLTEIVCDDIHIGKPIANTQIYIVDQYMQPIPIGVTGELCIAGDGVGAGYLNRPELTDEKFIDNPFGKGKLYKTGDLAYWRKDGNIAYVGRNDFQVKIRGLRIELGEIENAIDSVDGISQTVVVVRKNSEGRQLICAFYTGEEVDGKEIRNHIGKTLPKYMLPHIFTHIEEMPLTGSGKVNRKALPEVDLENIINDAEYVQPENGQQKLLCELMEQILDVSPVGIVDDFFDLGGDSLKAIEFVSKAHNEGIYVDLQSIFDHPTVKELWESIENGDKQEISFADVDFTEVNKVLVKNKVEHMTTPQKRESGNILLAGATGYLGVHILADYLEHNTGTAYCLVRGKDQEDSTKRLQELLNFYFGDRYADMHRIEVVCTDLQKDQFGLPDVEYAELVQKIHTVINCAASVKHYGSYKYFYEVNVETTKRLIDFCFDADAVLIHTSTMSVSGNSFGDDFSGSRAAEEKTFTESTLYIGQPLDNVYARSKFEAEKAVLDAMTHGLRANIMRMGQLTNRASDGVFQMNHESNAYLKRMKSMLELGVVPHYMLNQYTEFTPIDDAANAVMTIVRHFSDEQTVFHIENPKFVLMGELIQLFGDLGYSVKSISQDAFSQIIEELGSDSHKRHILEAFINEIDENNRLNYESSIHIDLNFTVEYLRVLGFEWSDIDSEYMRKYVAHFRKIGYLK